MLVQSFKKKEKEFDWNDLNWELGFNLFLHSEEDEGKTEDPTETKKRKAREEGQVFLTQELPQSLSFLVALSIIFILANFYFREMSRYLQNYLENDQKIIVDRISLNLILKENIFLLVKLILPIGAGVIFCSTFFTMIQTKFLFSAKNLKINWKKIAPSWKNFTEKTIFTRHQIINSIKIIMKVSLTGLITYFFIKNLVPELWQLSQLNIFLSFKKMFFWIFELGMYFCGFMLLLSLPDWLLQKIDFMRKIKMTKEEVKREIKELEGDPQIKKKQRERAREIATQNIPDQVKKADVVITNPTHFACAIAYDQSYMDAPKVVVKGIDFIALKIRKIAEENQVPIVENKPLARAIYEQVEIDQSIPPEFYYALSEVLKTLDKFKSTVT